MRGFVKKIADFIEELQASVIYDSAMPEKSSIREEVCRIKLLAQGASQGIVDPISVDALEQARHQIAKSKGTFHAGMTCYPVGTFMVETVHELCVQERNDQLLSVAMDSAVEIANSVKVEVNLKEKDGELEVLVASAGKLADMTSKWASFTASASDKLKASHGTKAADIEKRLQELQDSLAKAAAARFEHKYKDAIELLRKGLSEGDLTAENAAIISTSLASLQKFQALPRVPLSKLLGKDLVSGLDSALSCALDFGQILGSTTPKLLALVGEVTETTLMHSQMTSLWAKLHEQDLHTRLDMVAPIFDSARVAVETFLTNKSVMWLRNATSSFQQFICNLLDNTKIDELLNLETVGALDINDKDGWSKVHFISFYGSFLRFMPQRKMGFSLMKQPEEEAGKAVPVPMVFLCGAGILLEICKHVLYFSSQCDKIKQKPGYLEYVNTDDPKKALALELKTAAFSSLKPVCQTFAIEHSNFSQLMKSAETGLDNLKEVFVSLNQRVAGILSAMMQDCNEQLIQTCSWVTDVFGKISQKHALSAIFNEERLNKAVIGQVALDSKKLIYGGAKASDIAKDLSEFLEGLACVPVEEGVYRGMVHDSFASDKNPKVMVPEGKNATLSNLAWYQGSLTVAQCLSRDLQPGETRVGLASRCVALIEAKRLGCEPLLLAKAQQIKTGK